MAEDLVDAVELLNNRDRERDALEKLSEKVTGGEQEGEITGERGAADLKAVRRAPERGAKAFVAFLVLGALGIAIFLGFKAYALQKSPKPNGKGTDPSQRIEKAVPALELDRRPARGATGSNGHEEPGALLASVSGVDGLAQRAAAQPVELAPQNDIQAPPPPPGMAPAPVAVPQWPQGQAGPPHETVQERRLARGFGGATSGEGGLAPAPGAAVGEPAAADAVPRQGSVAEKLEPTELVAASATLMKDRDFMVTRGTMLDCVLDTKIISTVPGLVACYLTRDVYGTNGRVKLMDRGGRLTGGYKTGMQQGEARIFVTWGRLENPNGVIVNLDSPGTGALGEGGVGGWTDTHFLDRFGAAMLVSIIGGVTDAGAARLAGPAQGRSLTLNDTASATKQVVNKTFDATVNMPPTLYVNQGERIGVYVARDLSFRSVYGQELADHGDE